MSNERLPARLLTASEARGWLESCWTRREGFHSYLLPMVDRWLARGDTLVFYRDGVGLRFAYLDQGASFEGLREAVYFGAPLTGVEPGRPWPDHCPRCAAALFGPPKPTPVVDICELLDRNQVIPPGYDGTLYWQCPTCEHRWHRWDRTSPIRKIADRSVDADWARSGPSPESCAVLKQDESSAGFTIHMLHEQPGSTEAEDTCGVAIELRLEPGALIGVHDERQMLDAASDALEAAEYIRESGWWRTPDGYAVSVERPQHFDDAAFSPDFQSRLKAYGLTVEEVKGWDESGLDGLLGAAEFQGLNPGFLGIWMQEHPNDPDAVWTRWAEYENEEDAEE